jgi:hypothetical protein
MTTKNLSESLIRLMEDEMDRAELVLAAKAILDKLQDMAEDLAKVEADDVLPLLDGIRSQFGPQYADNLNNAATETMRSALEAVKSAKDKIGQVVQGMEGIVTGDGSNDMAMNVGTDDEGPADMDSDMGDDTSDQQFADDAADAETGDTGGDAGSDELAGQIDDILGGDEDNGENPEGRTRKESAQSKGNALNESEDPDMVLATATLKLVKESKKTISEAASIVAESYGVDIEDITVAVRDYVESLKMDKLLGENTKQWAKTVLSKRLAMREGKNVGAIEAYLTTDRLNAANAFASGKITESQCIKLAKI